MLDSIAFKELKVAVSRRDKCQCGGDKERRDLDDCYNRNFQSRDYIVATLKEKRCKGKLFVTGVVKLLVR